MEIDVIIRRGLVRIKLRHDCQTYTRRRMQKADSTEFETVQDNLKVCPAWDNELSDKIDSLTLPAEHLADLARRL